MAIQVIVKEVPKSLSLVYKISSKLPGFCSYCGKRYVKAYSNNINLLFPYPQEGKICPDGHEGYMIENILCGIIKHKIDNIKKN